MHKIKQKHNYKPMFILRRNEHGISGMVTVSDDAKITYITRLWKVRECSRRENNRMNMNTYTQNVMITKHVHLFCCTVDPVVE